jgi:hypothetical protein
MSDDQVNLIVKILLDEEHNLSDGFQFYLPGRTEDTAIYLGEIAKLILTKLKQQQTEKAEKKQDEKDKIDGKIPFDCSG